MIRSLTLEAPAWNRREIMRYARIRGAEHSYDALIEECIAEAEKALSYRVCYTVLDVTSKDGILTLGDIPAESQTIKKAIGNAERILLFAATVGAQFDRLIHRYSMIVPSKP